MAGYSSSVTIEELDEGLSAIRTLVLKGPGLPKQGANWGGENVVPTTWYPGNPDDATQQVLVAKELPTRWEGMWHLTMLNRVPCELDGVATASPGFLVDVVDDMRRKGRLLRVTWAVVSDDPDVARTVVRLGRIARFDAKYQRSTDVDWELEWSWKSRGGVQGRVVSTRHDDVASAATALQNAAAAAIAAVETTIQNANGQVRKSATQFSLSQLSLLLDAPLALVRSVAASFGRIVSQIDQVAGLAEQARALPFEVASAAVDLARNTIDLGNQFLDVMSRTPVEQTTLSNNVSDLTRSFRYFNKFSDQVAEADQKASEMELQIRQAASANAGRGAVSAKSVGSTRTQDVLAIRRTKEGDTPTSLSMLYYGTPDRDLDILRFNRLPWHQATFEPGTLIVVPVLSTSKGA